ncbi:MAG: hypothetical protein HY598_05385 [Candidatus Omnitrophica bacterium]|nr:hypothetical protein [Candidatus Omnitrophota bacterium]
MKRQAGRASQQGLLLVEAVLSAVVIAVGLVFVSRALGGQLRALAVAEAYDTLLPLARAKLLELEGWGLKQAPIPSQQLSGSFDDPYEGYQWRVRATPHHAEAGGPSMTDVVLTVSKTGEPGRAVTLMAVWPSSWF